MELDSYITETGYLQKAYASNEVCNLLHVLQHLAKHFSGIVNTIKTGISKQATNRDPILNKKDMEPYPRLLKLSFTGSVSLTGKCSS